MIKYKIHICNWKSFYNSIGESLLKVYTFLNINQTCKKKNPPNSKHNIYFVYLNKFTIFKVSCLQITIL